MKSNRRDRYLTVMLVPEGRRSVNSWVLPAWLFKCILCLAMAVIFTLAGAIGIATHLKNKVEQLHYIEQQNTMQAQQINHLQQQAQLLQQKIEEVDRLDQEVRSMLGLETGSGQRPSEASRSGRGTRPQEDTLRQVQVTLATVAEACPDREESLKVLAEEVQEHLDYQAALPSHWPLKGQISSYFGYRVSPFGWRQEFHDGLDIAADYGTEVQATGDGRVIFAGYQAGYGYTVIIDHGYGLTSKYSHNSRNLVAEGDEVVRGQGICRVGSSGRSTGPHLHFGVALNNQAVDPLDYLEGKKASNVQEKK